MTGHERTPTDLAALRHPLFWAALALLVLNDHVFKGAGFLPGWLTGKLSDFAGLIVAPIVLSVLLRARTDRMRALAFAVVGGWFTAANLFAPVAAATSEVASWVGLSWTFWVDPTDLVALSVLPVAWHLARRGESGVGALTERLALGLGVAACVASPPPEPSWTTDAFLVNDTGRRLELRVRWVEASVDCDAIRDRYAETLPRDVFGPGTTFIVDVDATLPLDRGVAETGGGRPWDAEVETPHVGNCDVVMLSADGLPETMVFWSGLRTYVIPDVVESSDDREAVQDGLRLVAEGEAGPITVVDGPQYLHDAPVELYDGGASCRDYGAVTGFDWSELPGWAGARVRLHDVRPTIDGCVALELEALDDFGAEPFEAFLCVPPEDFPFHRNAEVRITVQPTSLRIVRDLELEDGSLWRTGELLVVRGVSQLVDGPFALRLTEVDAACGGVRMDCGGFRVPAAGGLRAGTTTTYVHPGDVVERDADDGRRARLRVGRSETMWVTHAACGAGRDQLGERLEALVVYGEEPR